MRKGRKSKNDNGNTPGDIKNSKDNSTIKFSRQFLNLTIKSLGKEVNTLCLMLFADSTEYHEELIRVNNICRNHVAVTNTSIPKATVENMKKTITVYGVKLMENDQLMRNIINSNIPNYSKKFYMIYLFHKMLKEAKEYPEITESIEKFLLWSSHEIFYPRDTEKEKKLWDRLDKIDFKKLHKKLLGADDEKGNENHNGE